jgi:hypothetical protein
LAVTHAINFGAGNVDVVILDNLFAAGKVLPDLLQQMPVRNFHLYIWLFIRCKDMNSGWVN